jgi:hypothetical protein
MDCDPYIQAGPKNIPAAMPRYVVRTPDIDEVVNAINGVSITSDDTWTADVTDDTAVTYDDVDALTWYNPPNDVLCLVNIARRLALLTLEFSNMAAYLSALATANQLEPNILSRIVDQNVHDGFSEPMTVLAVVHAMAEAVCAADEHFRTIVLPVLPNDTYIEKMQHM